MAYPPKREPASLSRGVGDTDQKDLPFVSERRLMGIPRTEKGGRAMRFQLIVLLIFSWAVSITHVSAAGLDNCGTPQHLTNSPHCADQYQFCSDYANMMTAIFSVSSGESGIDDPNEMLSLMFHSFAATPTNKYQVADAMFKMDFFKSLGHDRSLLLANYFIVFQRELKTRGHNNYTFPSWRVVADCVGGTLDFLHNDGTDLLPHG